MEKETKQIKTQLNLSQGEIKAIRKLLLKKQEEQITDGEYGIFNKSIEMELYQLFTSLL